MGLLTIRKYGDPILRETCQPLNEISDATRLLIDDMAKTMYEYKGVGLAASQVGVRERVVIVDSNQELISLVNPEILSREGREVASEGCLSIPDVEVDVERATKIIVEGLDREGKRVELTLDGLVAREMQHEIDHLNGILIIDYLSFVKRQLVKKRLAKKRPRKSGTPVRGRNTIFFVKSTCVTKVSSKMAAVIKLRSGRGEEKVVLYAN